MEAELVGFSFAVKEKEAWYIAVKDNREEALKMLSIFKPLFEDEKILKVGQNIKYDMEVLHNYGITVKGRIFDTMLAHYIIQPELHHGMDYLAEVYLHYQTVHIEELIGPKGKGRKTCVTYHQRRSMLTLARMPILPCASTIFWNQNLKRLAEKICFGRSRCPSFQSWPIWNKRASVSTQKP